MKSENLALALNAKEDPTYLLALTNLLKMYIHQFEPRADKACLEKAMECIELVVKGIQNSKPAADNYAPMSKCSWFHISVIGSIRIFARQKRNFIYELGQGPTVPRFGG